MVGIELGARGLGNPIHRPKYERNGAGWRRCSCLRGGRLVEEGEDALHRYCESLAGVDRREKCIRTAMAEVAHLQA
jgi:hypothetical protein